MKKKIAIFLYSLAAGGAERQVSILLKKLLKHYEITLVLMNDTIFYEIPSEVEVVYLEKSMPDESGLKKLLKLPLLAWRYKKVLRQRGITTSLSFMTRPNYINVLAKMLGSKCYTLISERSHFSLQYSYGDVQSWINKKLVRLYNQADLIVPNAKMNGWDLQNNFGITAPMQPIYNFVDIDKIQELSKDRIEIEKKGFVFVTVGRLDTGKNHALLIEALKRCGCDAELWIVGDGSLKELLELKVETLGLQSRVKLLGKQKNPYKYLAKADCFVFGSNHEGFPNVLLEALACALPVISTDCKSGPREILSPKSDLQQQTEVMELGAYGMLTPVNDADAMAQAMDLMINDEKVRYNYKSIAKKRALDFDVDKILKEWIKVFDG